MKKVFLNLFEKGTMAWLMAIILVCGTASLTACGDDKDDDNPNPTPTPGNLDTPTYEKESALYTVTTPNSKIKSIELTASGNYIVTQNRYASRVTRDVTKQKHVGFAWNAGKQTRAYEDDGIIYGTYTKKSDGTFVLEGFGTIVIEGGENNAVSLNITRTDGTKIEVSAQKHEQYASSTKTNWLCRTWNIGKAVVNLTIGNETIYDNKTFNTIKDFWREFYQGYEEEIGSSSPKQVIFTKSGTYMVFYEDETLAVSTWAWTDESAGKARYSWNYESLNDPYQSGQINVAFSAGQCLITEILDEDGDSADESIRGSITYYLSEAN